MITFNPGVAKTAKAPITVSPLGLSCQAELFLGPDPSTKVATSGLISFTSTGVAQQINLPIVMPSSIGTYHVYLDVYAAGILMGSYIGTEDVQISVSQAVLSLIDVKSWRVPYYPDPRFDKVFCQATVINTGNADGLCDIYFWYGYLHQPATKCYAIWEQQVIPAGGQITWQKELGSAWGGYPYWWEIWVGGHDENGVNTGQLVQQVSGTIA